MNSTVKSARRVFEVLEFLAEVRAPRKAHEIARHLKYPMSSTAALLKSMSGSGYLAFERKSRTYFPTVRLFQLTARLHPLLRPVAGKVVDGANKRGNAA